MSIYEEANEVKTQADYVRVKNELAKNIAMRDDQEKELKSLGLSDEQILTAMVPIDLAIDAAQISITQWETRA